MAHTGLCLEAEKSMSAALATPALPESRAASARPIFAFRCTSAVLGAPKEDRYLKRKRGGM